MRIKSQGHSLCVPSTFSFMSQNLRPFVIKIYTSIHNDIESATPIRCLATHHYHSAYLLLFQCIEHKFFKYLNNLLSPQVREYLAKNPVLCIVNQQLK